METIHGFVLTILLCAVSSIGFTGLNAQNAQQRYNVAILLFDHVQIIDYTGPYEVFGSAGMNVFTVSKDGKMLNTAMNMQVTPTHSFATCPEFDILILPGGGGFTPAHGGVGAACADAEVMQWIKTRTESADHVMSVCNGAFFLAYAGLLDEQEATTFWGMIPVLDSLVPSADVVNHKRFTDNGKILTTAGLSSGIDGSLHLIEKLYSRGRAQMVALGLEYDWKPEGTYARAALADRYMRFLMDDFGTTESMSREGNNEEWESTWRITGATGDEIFESVTGTITANTTWGPGPFIPWQKHQEQPSKRYHSAWKFQDEHGNWWKGIMKVTPVDGKSDEHMLSISVEKQ